MDYPTPPPSPHANSSTQLASSSTGWMDRLFGLQRGASWPLHRWYDALRRNRPNAFQFGVVSMQHRKRMYSDFQHEFLVLDVVTLVYDTNTPEANASHMYIEVGRSGDEAQMSFFGIWGAASDQVLILRQEDEANVAPGGGGTSQYPAGECLATLSWDTELPNLLDVFGIMNMLSLTYPNYNIFTRQCYWFARAVYLILRYGYAPTFENTGNKHWERARFYFLVGVLTPKPPASFYLFCRRLGDN